MAQASGFSLILLLLMLALNIQSVLGAIGTGTIAVALILIVVSFVVGMVFNDSGSAEEPRATIPGRAGMAAPVIATTFRFILNIGDRESDTADHRIGR